LNRGNYVIIFGQFITFSSIFIFACFKTIT